MAKISTPENPVKIVVPDSYREAQEQPVLGKVNTPSAHIISNILNYSKALEIKSSGKGNVIVVVKN